MKKTHTYFKCAILYLCIHIILRQVCECDSNFKNRKVIYFIVAPKILLQIIHIYKHFYIEMQKKYYTNI